jgi:hypothetical protein
MKTTRHTVVLIFAVAAVILVPTSRIPAQSSDTQLEQGFKNPPDSAKPRAYYFWLNGNITKEGITADLEWMHRVGIAGVQLFEGDVGIPQFVEKRLAWMTPEWKDAMRHTAEETHRLNMEIAMAASGGWSETGGPSVKPQAAMKKIVWSETLVQGPVKFSGVLPHPPTNNGRFQDMAMPVELLNPKPQGLPGAKPEPPAPPPQPSPTFYADTRVVAYRLPESEILMADAHPRITASEAGLDLAALTDGSFSTEVTLHLNPGESHVWVQFEFPQPYRAQALLLGGGNVNFFTGGTIVDGELQSSDDGVNWTAIASLSTSYFIKRDFPIQTYSFPPTTARSFRVMLRPAAPEAGLVARAKERGTPPPAEGTVRLAELELSGPRVTQWQGKAAYGNTSDYSTIATPPVEKSDVVRRGDVIDLTSQMHPDGSLEWEVPAGRWVILRLGYSLVGKKVHPATAEATGYEVDKLSAQYVGDYVKDYADMFSSAVGPNFGKSFRYFHMDSWEAGVENWTDTVLADFQVRRGYDPTPYLPVLTGRIVESAEASDRFLWDYRRTLADLLAENHYGLATQYFNKLGVGLYAEAVGPFLNTTADALLSKGQLDIPMGEFWTPPLGRKDTYYHCTDIWEAASAAHIYGKKIASAEAFSTDVSAPVWASPYYLKPVGDRALSYGVNRFVLSTAVLEPFVDEAHKPGLTLNNYGQHYARTNTWAEQSVAFNTYVARSSFLLQQGQFVGDLAYFYGEGAPATIFFWKPLNPPLPQGYAADWMNADVILNRLSVRDGRLVLPDGMSYKVLVIPDYVTQMTLPLLRKIRDLVAGGGIVVAAKPTGSPSLADEGKEAEYRNIVVQLWGIMDGMSGNEHDYGKGKIYWGKPIEEVLAAQQTPPDFEHNMPEFDTDLVWIHRRDGDRDIYFVANQKDRPEDLMTSFRVEGKEAELWHPDTGLTEPAEDKIENGRTSVPLRLDPCGSVFVVFQHATSVLSRTLPHPVSSELATLEGPWRVSFPPNWGAPPQVRFNKLASWTENPDDGVKYFSGTATYTKDIVAPQSWFKPGAKVILDLGAVKEIAEVSVNGKAVGGILWKPPFRADVTLALKPGNNHLEVKITNLWPNRIIGDQQPNATKKYAWLDYRPFKANTPLLESGLMGPVKLLSSTAR